MGISSHHRVLGRYKIAGHLENRSSSSHSLYTLRQRGRAHTAPARSSHDTGNSHKSTTMSQQDSDPSRPGSLPLRQPDTPRNSPSSSPASAAPSSTLVPSSLSQPPSDTESQNGLHRISYGQMLKAIWKETHYTCVLLPFIPVGIALHFINVSPVVVFVINFFAIVPLAAVCPVPVFFSFRLPRSSLSFERRGLLCLCLMLTNLVDQLWNRGNRYQI